MGPPTKQSTRLPLKPATLEVNTLQRTEALKCFTCLWLVWTWIKKESAASVGTFRFTTETSKQTKESKSGHRLVAQFKREIWMWFSSVTHVDDERQWLSWMVFNQLLLVGSKKLRILHIFQGELWCMRVLVFFKRVLVFLRGGVRVILVEDSIQKKPHWGLVGLAGRRRAADDHGRGDHFTLLHLRRLQQSQDFELIIN